MTGYKLIEFLSALPASSRPPNKYVPLTGVLMVYQRDLIFCGPELLEASKSGSLRACDAG